MLQLQITTDYAIRIIGYLYSKDGDLAQTLEISKEMGITYPYTMKIIHRLKNFGLIESKRGPQGGYSLTESSKDLTLYDIIAVMEGDICINRCLEPDGYCSRNATKTCNVHKTLSFFQTELVNILKSKKICEIWDEKVESQSI